jgi:outer membrane lipoprotein carrier protein
LLLTYPDRNPSESGASLCAQDALMTLPRRSFNSLALILVVSLLGSGIVPGQVHAEPDARLKSALDIADKVQAVYDSSKTFRSSFKQRYYIAAHDTFRDSNGSVVFQKPGKMSWHYDNNGNRVVSDGKLIKVYEKENNQMFEQSIDKSQYPAALSFLLGGGQLKKEFKLSQLEAKDLGFEGGYVLLGEPVAPTPAYQKILLFVDARTFHVRRVLMIDAQRNRNRFDFVDPIVNHPVDASEFTFDPPPGTRIVRP